MEHYCVLTAADGDIVLQTNDDGVPQGSGPACDVFNDGYDVVMKEYDERTTILSAPAMAVSPISGNMVNLAHTRYVDDLMSKCPFTALPGANYLLDSAIDALSASLAPAGMCQNTSKLQPMSLIWKLTLR